MKALSRRHILEAGAVTAALGGAAVLQVGDQTKHLQAGEEVSRSPGIQQGFFAITGYAHAAGEQSGHEISFPHNYGPTEPIVTAMNFFNWNVSTYVIAHANPFGALVTVTARDVGQFYCEFIWTATPQ